jgi:hypothetical protein
VCLGSGACLQPHGESVSGHRNLRPSCLLGQELAVFDTPDRVGRRVFQVSFNDGTQKPEK